MSAAEKSTSTMASAATEMSTIEYHDTLNQNEPPLVSLIKEANDEALPFLDQLLENPLEFSLPVVSDVESEATVSFFEEVTTEQKVMKDHDHGDHGKHTFCGSMMMMSSHEMAQHGVGSMPLGGDMSKGMVMYMDGFRFAMAGNQPCLNLFFPSWTLDTRFKFLLALAFVFALSFGAEATSKFRHNLSARPTGRDYESRRTRQMVISVLHGFQALLGYVVMLATMTFSLEILFSVVAGLSVGYYYYFAGEVGLEGHVTTNPCCNFMQDESDEHEQRQQQHVAAAAALAPAPCCDDPTTSLLAAERQGLADTSNV